MGAHLILGSQVILGRLEAGGQSLLEIFGTEGKCHRLSSCSQNSAILAEFW